MKLTYVIEPENPVTSPEEFADELVLWTQKEGKELDILSVKDYPQVQCIVDGKSYLAKLEPPRPNLINLPSATYSMGFKFIYLYDTTKE
ncbi:MAG: hypothetical protein Q4Q17_00255 [Tissierellia bacterium]|nr:hypothetical protein [Tissierellia bacterium]